MLSCCVSPSYGCAISSRLANSAALEAHRWLEAPTRVVMALESSEGVKVASVTSSVCVQGCSKTERLIKPEGCR